MATPPYATALAAISACLFLGLMVDAQSPNQAGVRPPDVSGWSKTRWGMSESEVKREVHGRWRRSAKEERDGDGDLYMPFVLQDVKIGGRNFIGLFGFALRDRRLIRVDLHSGFSLIRHEEATVVFERLADELQRELGPPIKIIRNNSGHTGVYADFAVWRFPSTVIELHRLKPNDKESAIVLSYAPPSEADR
jgi:hypothetical protein